MHSQDLNKEDVWSVYAPNQPVSFPTETWHVNKSQIKARNLTFSDWRNSLLFVSEHEWTLAFVQ